MAIPQNSKKTLQRILFGESLIPQEFFLGLSDPQAEVAVWLCGFGEPIDVTCRHSMACAEPFSICIAMDEKTRTCEESPKPLTLEFRERAENKRRLGEISLESTATITAGGRALALFEARGSKNWCLSNTRLWTHYSYYAYKERRRTDTSGMKMSFKDKLAAMVMFIRPHPVSLVSLTGEAGGNIFPMNIMGDLGNGYVGFALKDCRRAAHLVESAGRIAVSSVPFSHAHLAYKLAINHTKDSIAWEQLPFSTMESSSFHIPAPAFAQRVRELVVERVHPIGSHTFFAAKIVSDHVFSTAPQLCVIHGFYQAWRMRGHREELHLSLTEDAMNKRGI